MCTNRVGVTITHRINCVCVCVWFSITLDLRACNDISKCNVNSLNFTSYTDIDPMIPLYHALIYQPFLSILSRCLRSPLMKIYCTTLLACVCVYVGTFDVALNFEKSFYFPIEEKEQSAPSNKNKFVLIFIYANVKRC